MARALSLILLLSLCLLVSCRSSKNKTQVLRPKTHKIWPAGNKYVIDIPVGARHIRLLKRRTTKMETLR